MGNPLSPVVANIYMEHFEALAIESARLKPATWLRYVDDTFVVWNEGMDKLQDFLEHLNNQTQHSVYDGAGGGWKTSFPGCAGHTRS